MKILLINHYAGSPALGMEYRPFYLAREWVRAGHPVRILAASESHVRGRRPDLGGASVRHEQDEGIDYVWYRTPAYQGNGLGRMRNILSFLRKVGRDAGAIARDFRPDVVIASSTYPMDIWVARRLARLAGARLVYEVHDLWPLSPMELGGMSRWHPFILLVQAAEDSAYRHADVVVSMLPRVHAYMASRGLDLAKLHVVPNGISPDEWEGSPAPLPVEVARALEGARSRGHVVVGYAGSHGVANALDTLLAVARKTLGSPITYVLVGDGMEKDRLVRRASGEGLSNVVFLPPVPKATVRAVLAEFDVAYLGWTRSPLYRFGIAPNKLMDYMMAGLPVVHSVDAGNDPVAEAGCGISTAPGDADAAAEAICRMAALSPGERRALGERGRVFVSERHTYPVLARRFLEAVAR